MMIIPRYVIGKTTLSELQRERVLSPAMAARTKLAKFGAIGALAEAGVKAIQAKQEFDERIELAEDQTEMNAIETAAKVKAKQFENDPRWRLPVQEDGTPTVDAMRKQADTDRLEVMGQISKIKNPRRREVFNQKLTSVYALYEPDIQKAIDLKRIELSTNQAFDNIEIAVAAGEFPSARKQLNDLVSAGHINEQAKDKSMAYIDQKEVQFQAEALVTMIDSAYAEDAQTGDAKYRELMADTDLPRQVRDMAIDGAEEKKAEWAKARHDQALQVARDEVLDFGDFIRRANEGLATVKEAESKLKNGTWGKGESAARKFNQAMDAIIEYQKKMETTLNIQRALEGSYFIEDTLENRKALDVHVLNSIQGLDQEEAIGFIGDTSRALGTVPHSVSEQLGRAGDYKDVNMDSIVLYRELVKDKTQLPNLHIDANDLITLAEVDGLLERGMTLEEANEVVWEAKHPTDDEKILRAEEWTTDLSDKRNKKSWQKGFKQLLKSDTYDVGFFEEREDPTPLMRREYAAVFKKAFDAYGNAETAREAANMAISRAWVLTNLNSDDPDDFVIMKHGLIKHAEKLRHNMLAKMDLENVRYRVEGRDIGLDSEHITFSSGGGLLVDAYTEAGEPTYSVLYKGLPVYEMIEGEAEVAVIILESQDVMSAINTGKQRQEYEHKLADYEAERKRIVALMELEQPFFKYPGQVGRAKERIEYLERSEKRIREELKGVRF